MMQLLSISYWFKLLPSDLPALVFWALVLVSGIFLLLWLLSLFIKRRKGLYSRLIGRLGAMFLGQGLFLLLLLFFSYERVVLFASRFWLLIWFLSTVFWTYLIFLDYRATIMRREERQKNEEFRKYLPR